MNMIKFSGASETFPPYCIFFQEVQWQDTLCIPVKKPDAEQLLSVKSHIEICKTQLVSTSCGTSCEGQTLTGHKICVEGKVNLTVEYASCDPSQSVHTSDFTRLFSSFLVLPRHYESKAEYNIIPYLENVFCMQLSCRELYCSLIFVLNFEPFTDNLCTVPVKAENVCEKKKPSERMFREYNTYKTVPVPKGYPEPEQVLSTIIDPEVLQIETINTMKGKSCEGQILTGKKLFVLLHIRLKILYSEDSEHQIVHAFCTDFLENVYLSVPNLIEGTEIEYFIIKKKSNIKALCENAYAGIRNTREFQMSINLLVQFTVTHCYELCLSQSGGNGYQGLFLAHADGSRHAKLTVCDDEAQLRKPQWSPLGNELAWILEQENHSDLVLSDYKGLYKINCTKSESFHSIGSFCWTSDGRNLIFSASMRDVSELFTVDKSTFLVKQLTRSDGLIQSYHPACGENSIFFLRNIAGVTDIWSIGMDGMELKKLTETGCVKSFDYSLKANIIVYICTSCSGSDELFIYHIQSCKNIDVESSSGIPDKKKVRLSPDGRFAALIGTNCGGSAVYVVSIYEKRVKRISNRISEGKITDISWSADSNMIFYVIKESARCTALCVDICDCSVRQITRSNCCDMELSYRPKLS